MKQTYQTSQPLEYIALLSGLSMAGTDVSDTDIKNTRLTHTKDKTKRFSFASLVTAPKH